MDGDNNDDSDDNNVYPFAWVIVPLLVFGLVTALLTCYRVRRRRRVMILRGSTAALHQDVEAASANRPRGEGGGGFSRGRDGGRGFGIGSRDEGLNELGEAPPAYNSAVKKSEGDGSDIELRHLNSTGDTGRAAYSQAVDMDQAGTSTGLPGYDGARRTSPAETGEPTVPPRVVLPSG
ncbi:hypothetical protein F5Y15DRAFT_12749 [Xylariaceae sp. FL0016]|nr:hypothetical protein F5Y15DRAFT_12749 [Xylariaceae sp. FL0016]